MQKKGLFILSIWIILLISLASAEIIFQRGLDDVYNVDDPVYVNFSISKKASSSGFVGSTLICNGEELEIYRRYHFIEKDEKENFVFEFPALIEGECNINVEFDGESVSSNAFEISDDIEVNYELNNKFFFPLEKVLINGSAVKANGDDLKGIVEINVGDILNRTIEVSDGKFSAEIEIGEWVAAGDYNVVVEASEKNAEEEVINFGSKSKTIKVNPNPSSISIEAAESVGLPANYSIKASLLDQGGNLILNETVGVRLFNPEGDIVFEKSVKSGESFVYFFESGAERGGWEIISYHGNINSVKPVYVLENREIEVEIINESGRIYLGVRNIGNIGYEGVLDVFVSNASYEGSVPVNVHLGIGEDDKYSIDYKGLYNLSTDGQEFLNVPLTGASIFLDSELGIISYFIFFCLVFLIVAFFVMKRKGVFRRLRFRKGIAVKKNEKIAYVGFFKFSKPLNSAEDFAKKYSFSFTKINEHNYFVLFYSVNEKSAGDLFNLAKKISESALLRGVDFSIALNCDKYKGKASFIKALAGETKKILGFSDNNILMSESFHEKIGMKLKKIEFEGKRVFVY